MRKRPAVHLALAFLLGDIGVHCGTWFAALFFLVIVLDVGNLCLLHWGRGKTAILVFLIVSLFFCGVFRTRYLISQTEEKQNIFKPSSCILIEGEIYKKEQKNETIRYYLRSVRTMERKIGRIVMTDSDEDIAIGTWLTARCRVMEMRQAENEGGFDERGYYRSLGIILKCSLEARLHEDKPFILWKEYLYRLRTRMNEVYCRNLYGEEAGLLAMMTLGDKSSADEQAKELFSSAGLSHIFAISGLHISIVGMGLYIFLRKRKQSFLRSGIVSAVIVTGYACMVGMAVSTVRAVGMFIVLLLSQILGEAYDTLSALAVMSLLILADNPLALEQAAFVFSFMAVIGMVTVTRIFVDAYHQNCRIRWEQTHQKSRGRRWKMRFHERVWTSLLFGLSLQIATLPVVAYYFFAVPTYVIFLNLLLIPFLGILLGCGLLGGLLGCVFSFAGSIILFPCHLLLYYFEMLAETSLRLPWSQWVIGKPALWQILCYYLVLWILTYRLKQWTDLMCEKHEQSKEKASIRRKHQREVYGGKRMIIIASMIVVFLCWFIKWKPFSDFEVVALSVGQGDGLYIDSGMGERYFIDGGSSSKDELAKYTLLPFLRSRGVGQIDIWFLTHMDMDHVSGFMEILEKGYRVRRLVLAEALEKTDRYREICLLCQKYHVPISYMQAGERMIFKSVRLRKKELEWKVLAPENPSDFSGPNENSLVLWLSYRDGRCREAFDGVFTGDIATEQEEAIIRKTTAETLLHLGESSKVELLKAAHHGSNGSNSAAWLAALRPGLCIISAGKNNHYGHPGREAIARIKEQNIPYLCTIDSGQISVKWKNNKMVLKTYCQ